MLDQGPLQNGRGGVVIDGLLRDFFHAEMPQPWPRLRLPAAEPAPPRRASFWQRSGLRLAVAASVALVLTGYLALAQRFPMPATTSPLEHVLPPIGQRDGGHNRFVPVVPNPVEKIQTPQGRPAQVLEERIDEARPTIIINIQAEPSPKGRR